MHLFSIHTEGYYADIDTTSREKLFNVTRDWTSNRHRIFIIDFRIINLFNFLFKGDHLTWLVS